MSEREAAEYEQSSNALVARFPALRIIVVKSEALASPMQVVQVTRVVRGLRPEVLW